MTSVEHQKIAAPTPDTIVTGDWTLAQIVALMDRLTGVFAAIDFPVQGPVKHSLVSQRPHVRVPIGPDPNRHGYAIRTDILSRIINLSVAAGGHGGGNPAWKITIAHHKRPYRSEPWRQPILTSERLSEFCEAKEIEYVLVEGTGIEHDLAFANRFIDQALERLETVGPWLQDNLWLQLKCDCGRERATSARELFGRLPASQTISEALTKLCCVDCGKSAARLIAPCFENGQTALDRYRCGSGDDSQRLHLGDLDQLYETLGGDGKGPVYLGDGVSIGPDGTLSE